MKQKENKQKVSRPDWKPKEDWKTKLELQSQTMENPYFNGAHEIGSTNPKKIEVVKNLRESAIETLFARGKLDGTQKRAADKFRGIWETCGGAGTGASDYEREYVDGGGSRDPISQRQVDAGKALAECRKLLKDENYDLVQKVCGQGFSLSNLSKAKRGKLKAAESLRSSLDALAEHWGLKQKQRTMAA